MLSARKSEPYFPQVGEFFRDCPDCPEMVVVPAGTFLMGSRESEEGHFENEGPVRSVTVSHPFAIGKFEVTFAEWDACLSEGGCGGYRPVDRWGRGDQPAIYVSFQDAKNYVRWLSRKTGFSYRLPNEAEWEYAARAGSKTRYSQGEAISTKQANFDGRGDIYSSSAHLFRGHPVEVGSFPSNAFDLHDMHGNVWEWVDDCWTENYANAPTDTLEKNVNHCNQQALRGGSWRSVPRFVRSANRHKSTRFLRIINNGFRVVRTLQ